MVRFSSIIFQFAEKGEKTGWSYIVIPGDIAEKIKPGNKKSFRVKGKLDNYAIKFVAVIPMGDGSFIIPFNAAMRKGTEKRKGAIIQVELQEDKNQYELDKDFIACLQDEPTAFKFFNTLPGSHKNYFSHWIDSAKTDFTKTKRIAQAVSALVRKMGYTEMMREQKAKKDLL
ncbi:MAG: DUF1905 domain-containing protein [Bacteroidetes bacterium]|nr:DUF1905 domain-containing protein [Bacteroidota bacterium]